MLFYLVFLCVFIIEELSLAEEEREKERQEVISFEQALKEAGVTVDYLQY